MKIRPHLFFSVACLVLLLLAACAPAGGTPTAEHGDRPGAPVYQQLVYDCNTGQTLPADYTTDGPIQPDPGCDSWQINRYERPFNAGDQDIFFPDLDIMSAELGSDGQWFYFRLSVFDVNPETESLEGTYAIEIDIDIDGRGDVLILAHDPGEEALEDWTAEGVQFWGDGDNDVGNEIPLAPDSPYGTGGYDTLVFDNGEGDDANLAWVRVHPGKPVQLELAFRAAGIYNSPTFKWWAWTDQGIDDPALADYHDTYEHPEAGDPYRGSEFFPSQAINEMDNTCASIWGAEPGDDPDLCVNDDSVPPPVTQPTPTPSDETPTETPEDITPTATPTAPSETPCVVADLVVDATPETCTPTPSPSPTQTATLCAPFNPNNTAGIPNTCTPTPTECVPEIPEELIGPVQTIQASGGGGLIRGEGDVTPGPAADAWATIQAYITQTPGAGQLVRGGYDCTPTPTPTPTQTYTPTVTATPCVPVAATANIPNTCTPTPTPTPTDCYSLSAYLAANLIATCTPTVTYTPTDTPTTCAVINPLTGQLEECTPTPTDCYVPVIGAAANIAVTCTPTPTPTPSDCYVDFPFAKLDCTPTPTPTPSLTPTLCTGFSPDTTAPLPVPCTPTPTDCITVDFAAASVSNCTPTPTPTECVVGTFIGYDDASAPIYAYERCTPTPTPTECVGTDVTGVVIPCTPTPETAALMVFPEQDTNCRQSNSSNAVILRSLEMGMGYIPLGRGPDNLWMLFLIDGARCWAFADLFDIPFGPLPNVPAEVLPYINYPTPTPTPTPAPPTRTPTPTTQPGTIL